MGDDLRVFVSGGTGYIGKRLIQTLLDRGHLVAAVAREASAKKVPSGATVIQGNALDAASFAGGVRGTDTFVHLVGVSHPSPWKEAEFRAVDLAAVNASVAASRDGGVRNFIYVSVAQPAPVMKAYIAVRAECERIIAGAGFKATFVRPWYVLGPGHCWPVLLLPLYRLFERIPGKRETALRLGLVTIQEMVDALVWAVENPVPTDHGAGNGENVRIISVPRIREAAQAVRLPSPERDGDAATPPTVAQ